MQNYLLQVFDWLRNRWWKWKLVWRIVSSGGVLVALGYLITFVPHVRFLKEWYALASPNTQLMFLVVALIVIVALLLYSVDEWHRTKRLTEEKAKAETEKAEAEQKAKEAEDETKRLQSQWDQLLEASCRNELWQRSPGVIPPAFEPKTNRGTRFVTVLNLKGGVGKTTLAANLAAGLATGSSPLRVLLVDIDFQATLSRATVEESLIGVQLKHLSLVHRLLTTPNPDAKMIDQLAVAMRGVPRGRVILADGNLDGEEFQVQARFFVEPTADPRFRFRLHLHQPAIFEAFDVVIFDSPPRITASVVNAMACSDYVLIPTKLDDGSIDAVPRALAWMKSLGAICPAELLGVVASHANVRSGGMVKADNDSYEYLRGVVESSCGDGKKLLKAVVPHSAKAVGTDGQIGSLTADGQKVFAAVVKEVRGRMGL